MLFQALHCILITWSVVLLRSPMRLGRRHLLPEPLLPPFLLDRAGGAMAPGRTNSVNRQQTRQLAAMLQERDDSVVTALSTQDLRAAFEFA
jgi:hypothetical protein